MVDNLLTLSVDKAELDTRRVAQASDRTARLIKYG
jgi:hypothetical protein